MLKVKVWPEEGGSLTWSKIFLSKKSLHQPGSNLEIKRAYQYEPVVYRDGVINVPLAFPGGTNYVLVEKENFVAIWGHARRENRFSPTGYGIVTWFRYYFEPEARFSQPVQPQEPLVKQVNRLGLVTVQVQRLTWGQLGGRIQAEVTAKWQEVAPGWMQEGERIAKYRPGLIVSGKRGKTASITAADIVASDPTVIELGEVEFLTGRLSDDDILL